MSSKIVLGKVMANKANKIANGKFPCIFSCDIMWKGKQKC